MLELFTDKFPGVSKIPGLFSTSTSVETRSTLRATRSRDRVVIRVARYMTIIVVQVDLSAKHS